MHPSPATPQKTGGRCANFVNTSVCDVCTFHAGARLRKLEPKEAKPKIDGRIKMEGGPRKDSGAQAAGGRGERAGSGWGNTGGGPAGSVEDGLRMVEAALAFGLELRADGSLQPAANATERQVGVPTRPA